MGEQQDGSGKNDAKWAPWYIYVVLIVGCNLLKQKLLEGAPAAVNIAVTAIMVGALVLAITAVYRGVFAQK